MRLLSRPLSKNGVTRVTGVTPAFNQLNIKDLTQVTRENPQRHATCYVVKSCNNIHPATSRLVEKALVVKRWIHDPQRGQGAVYGR